MQTTHECQLKNEASTTSVLTESLLAEMIEEAAHLLPSQGPIDVFVHHNTLHAFEQLPFHAAVQRGYEVYGGEPYLSEKKYHDALSRGRIDPTDIENILKEELSQLKTTFQFPLASREEIRRATLLDPVSSGNEAELKWLIAETQALDQFRSEVPIVIREKLVSETQMWLRQHSSDLIDHTFGVIPNPDREKSTFQIASLLRPLFEQLGSQFNSWSEQSWTSFTLRVLDKICRHGATQMAIPIDLPPVRPRDLFLRVTGQDSDTDVDEFMIRFCASYFDHGYSGWKIPDREEGLYAAFVRLYSLPYGPPEEWLSELRTELLALQHNRTRPLQSILQSMNLLAIPAEQSSKFIIETLLALRGWAGMIRQLDSDPVDRSFSLDPLLHDFLAIRLILERHALRAIGRQSLNRRESMTTLLETLTSLEASGSSALSVQQSQRAFLIFQIAQRLGWAPPTLMTLSLQDWQNLNQELDAFTSRDRRRILHEAYERKYRQEALNAFAVHARDVRQQKQSATLTSCKRPSFQIVCCIDDREESFRRHLEEIDSSCETFGAAGFFAVAMYYRGAADATYQPLCPAIITPNHYVIEDAGYSFEGIHRMQTEARRRIGELTHRFHYGSRTFLGGIVTGLVGSLATFPLVARVIAPRMTSRIRSQFGAILHRPPLTRLQLERFLDEAGPENGHVGFSQSEMVNIVRRLLEDLGLTTPERFSRLVLLCGHGSSSLNNPHESAYCCGACAGKRGGPNARAFAQMANDWRVRAKLAKEGLQIPDDTTFVGAYHDTCSDLVVFYDLDSLPPSHRTDFECARKTIKTASKRNAHERCRRFSSASLSLDEKEALLHVEGRAEDLSQVRPEYNHATNAVCLVGRREWSRGLFLDRRAFLTSYDPRVDDSENSILLRILSAAIPVCAGINLEYYFSCVDPVVYGSGSKLPHNVSAMLGVMEGALSDLRTGLYQQMVEIHEPVRLLFVIETSPAAMLSILDRHELIRDLSMGGWVQIAVIDPETSAIHLFRNGEFEEFEQTLDTLPQVQLSREWYRNQRDHLPFCSIQPQPIDAEQQNFQDHTLHTTFS